MTVTVNSNNINFGTNIVYDGDVAAVKNVYTNHYGQWAWGYNGYAQSSLYGATQTTRGGYYVSRQIYGTTTLTDGYGANYSGTGLYYPSNSVASSYDSLSFANTSVGRSVYIKIELNIGRATDDATQSIVYRGGTPGPSPAQGPASLGGHTGGTQIYISGGTTASQLVFFDTVPANTTYTYWHYCGITGGSGGDGCTAWMNLYFHNFV